jgi:Mn2+/Fe2+ NRAMP family transporter
MSYNFILVLHSLNGIAIICTAVVFGTDVFFALIGKKSSIKSKESSIVDVFGHFHELADVRMPFFGATAILSTIAQVVFYGIHSIPGKLSVAALFGMASQLLIYILISKPVNGAMVDAVKFGRVLNNVRELQERWDNVILWRALSLLIAIICLIMINYVPAEYMHFHPHWK